MKLKKSTLILPVLLLFTACGTLIVPFDKSYTDKKINAVFYFDTLPTPYQDLPPLIFALHKNKIDKGFNDFASNSFPEVAYNTVSNSDLKQNNKFSIIVDNNFKNISIPVIDENIEAAKKDKTISIYDFNSLTKKPDYFLVLKTIKWGEKQLNAFNVGIYMDFTVTLYDTANNKKIWAIKGTTTAKFPPLITSWSDGYKKENVEAAFLTCLNNILIQIQKTANK